MPESDWLINTLRCVQLFSDKRTAKVVSDNIRVSYQHAEWFQVFHSLQPSK